MDMFVVVMIMAVYVIMTFNKVRKTRKMMYNDFIEHQNWLKEMDYQNMLRQREHEKVMQDWLNKIDSLN